jgi:hypothetical protein
MSFFQHRSSAVAATIETTLSLVIQLSREFRTVWKGSTPPMTSTPTPDPEENIFSHALELPAAERARYLGRPPERRSTESAHSTNRAGD